MSDEDTQAATTAEVENPPAEGDSQAGEGTLESETQPTEEGKTRLFLEDGRHVEVDEPTKRFWAERGLQAAARQHMQGREVGEDQPASVPPAKEEPVTEEAAGDEDDPVGRQVKQLTQKLDQATEKITKMEQEGQQEAEERKQASQQQQRERDINRIMDKYAKEADQDTRDMIRDKAARLYSAAVSEGRFMSLDEGIGAAAKFVGKRLVDKHANWLKAKKETKERAAEGPGGGAAISAPAAGAPKTKEQERALAREISDGTANKKAMEVWRDMVSQAAAT